MSFTEWVLIFIGFCFTFTFFVAFAWIMSFELQQIELGNLWDDIANNYSECLAYLTVFLCCLWLFVADVILLIFVFIPLHAVISAIIEENYY